MSNILTPAPPDTAVPALSLVVVAYDMARELPRTLYTLSTACQRSIHAHDYEIIIVDNGSPVPVDPAIWQSISTEPQPFRIIRIDDASPSPAAALNAGIRAARGQCIGAMIDGARMCSPGLLEQVLTAHRARPDAVICTLGWYLGYDYQRLSIACGYDQDQEDALLDATDWRRDGYQLFSISAMDESSVDGWHRGFSESNALFMSRQHWNALGGFDERFDLPGGGLVNLDLCKRALEDLNAPCILLLGEATFHQVHGGTATNTPPDKADTDWQLWSAQYEQIRARPYANPVMSQPVHYWGTLPPELRLHYLRGLVFPAETGATLPTGFLPGNWAMPDAVWKPQNLSALQRKIHRIFLQALQDGRHAWLAQACRHVRQHLPDWHAPLHLLSLVCPWSAYNRPLDDQDARLLDKLDALLTAGNTGQRPSENADSIEYTASPHPVDANRRCDQLQQQLADKEKELQALLSSRSWRWTAALRWLRRKGSRTPEQR